MKFLLNTFTALTLVMFLHPELGFTSNHHDSESAQASGTGHCNYISDGPFSEPYNACRTNMSEQACIALEEVGDGMMSVISPVYGEGDCSREATVGSCDRGGWEEVYYDDNDPAMAEFGCGFAGDWLEPQ